ncbi:MAG: archease [bacterium]
MKSYEYINHTADIGMRAYGRSLRELVQHAGEGFINLITDREKIGESLEEHIVVSAVSIEDLIIEWLNELNYLFEVKTLLFKRFLIDITADTALDACCRGERYDPDRHEIKTLIKAVTYHKLKVEKRGSVWEACIIFDI